MPEQPHQIVVVGAGCIGSVFAARFAAAGQRVSVVARGQRLSDLAAEGLRVRHRVTRQLHRYEMPVHASLAEASTADTVLVAVQQHQLDSLLPELAAHPAERIVLALNYSKPQDGLRQALGDRLVWSFPAMLAALTDGVVEYVVLPRALALAQVTTVGPVTGAGPEQARAVATLLRRSRIATALHADMYGWLLSHAALMAPIMAAGVIALETEGVVRIPRRRAAQIIRAQQEGFAAVRATGQQVTPANIAALAVLPAPPVGLGLWAGLANPIGRSALHGHADHGAGEVAEMLGDLLRIGADHRLRMPALASLSEDFESARRGV